MSGSLGSRGGTRAEARRVSRRCGPRRDGTDQPAPQSHPNSRANPVRDRSWMDFANCLGVDPDLFFPARGGSTQEAKEVCRGCAVREQCLEYALVTVQKFGIWGGTSERERRRLRRQRALARRQESKAP